MITKLFSMSNPPPTRRCKSVLRTSLLVTYFDNKVVFHVKLATNKEM